MGSSSRTQVWENYLESLIGQGLYGLCFDSAQLREASVCVEENAGESQGGGCLQRKERLPRNGAGIVQLSWALHSALCALGGLEEQGQALSTKAVP